MARRAASPRRGAGPAVRLLLAAVLWATASAGPTLAAPAPPQWATTRLYGANYLSLADLAKHLEGRIHWPARHRIVQIDLRGGVTARFELGERDVQLNGVRLMLSQRVVAARGELWVAEADVDKTLLPLLRPAAVAAALPGPPRLVVLDAGHGGSDPGKQNARHRLDEKDMTLDVVRRLKPLLEAQGLRVLLTREDDRRLGDDQGTDLLRRVELANRAKADLFLSIHFNAVEPRDAARVTGTETYVMTPQNHLSTADDAPDAMTPVRFPGNRQDEANVVLGYHLHRQLVTDLKTSDRGYKRGRLLVLRFAEMPAALVEAAYLSNDAEAGRVATPEFRQRIAEAVARGVQSYGAALKALAATPK